MKLIKKPSVLSTMACSNTTLYARIKEGLMTPPVHLGANSVAWPEHELNAVNAARASNISNDQLTVLVTNLVNLRSNSFGKTEADLLDAVKQLAGDNHE